MIKTIQFIISIPVLLIVSVVYALSWVSFSIFNFILSDD